MEEGEWQIKSELSNELIPVPICFSFVYQWRVVRVLILLRWTFLDGWMDGSTTQKDVSHFWIVYYSLHRSLAAEQCKSQDTSSLKVDLNHHQPCTHQQQQKKKKNSSKKTKFFFQVDCTGSKQNHELIRRPVEFDGHTLSLIRRQRNIYKIDSFWQQQQNSVIQKNKLLSHSQGSIQLGYFWLVLGGGVMIN